jgi:uncharacterized protein with PIN domain
MENAAESRLIADVMVGRLARWLRILGFDVLYSNRYEDDEILRIAVDEDRIVLTRDTGLAARLVPDRLIFIHHDDVDFQVDEVLHRVGQREFRIFSRCVECNTPLEKVDKESLFERVPPYVYLTQNEFAHCRSCGRIYWRGTHADRIADKVRRWKQI